MQSKSDKKIIIVSIVIVFLVLMIRIFSALLVAGDEFINYYNTIKIFNGERMWDEVNIITTPFIYLLGGLFFKVLGTKFIVYRGCNLIINIIFFALLYKTFRNLNINKKSSLIYTMILEIPTVSYVTLWGVTYNIVAVTFVLIGINLNFKRKKIRNYNLWQGLIILFIIFTKHNIGLYYAIAQVLIELVIEQKCKKITNLIKQFSVVIIGIIAFIIILFQNDLLISFIDMAVLGLAQFASNISINRITCLSTIGALILSGILIYKKKYDLQNKENTIILSITGIMILFMIFPIANTWHTILGSMILYIEAIYLLDFNKIKLDSNKILLAIDSYLILFIVLNMIFTFYCLKKEVIEFDFDKDSIFYLTAIKEPKRIHKIEEFIKAVDGNVLIVSPEAGIYNLNLNLGSHGFFDVPFNGNLGTNQLNRMIEKLKDYEDSYILIHAEKKYNQEIDEFRAYVDEKYNKLYEIDNFSVYKK